MTFVTGKYAKFTSNSDRYVKTSLSSVTFDFTFVLAWLPIKRQVFASFNR